MSVSVRVHEGTGPTLVYLPGLHGDWGLIGAFRRALGSKVRFVEFSYTKDPVALEALAGAVRAKLDEAGIGSGWLLLQSFGSQVGWSLVEQGFQAEGVILAGGFVRHPWPWGVSLFRAILSVPPGVIRPAYSAYTKLCNALSRRKPEEAAELMEFAAKRGPADWRAAAWRLKLIAGSDPRAVARRTTVPVYYLGGGIDPLVPWRIVTRWLKRECPGYKGETVFPAADHNVLGSAPRESAGRVLDWLGA